MILSKCKRYYAEIEFNPVRLYELYFRKNAPGALLIGRYGFRTRADAATALALLVMEHFVGEAEECCGR